MAKGVRTLQNKSLRSRLREHGFRARTRAATGILNARRAKGRKRLTAAG